MTSTDPLPDLMTVVLTSGHGGYEMLQYRHDVPCPRPKFGEVLIRVGAAGVNNTDINTRTGWYSKSISGATSEGGAGQAKDASWSGLPLIFPLI